MDQLDEQLKDEDAKLKETLKPITDPKLQNKTFMKRLFVYNRPIPVLVLGMVAQFLVAIVGPAFGILIIKTLFSMIMYVYDLPMLRSEVNKWCLIMLIIAISISFVSFTGKKSFGILAQNITINIRRNLYRSILSKHAGWHDNQENAAGVLSAILASDVQKLNGASSEAFVVMIEAAIAIVAGMVVAFIFSWPVALISFVMGPAMVLGGFIGSKLDKESFESSD
jgi:ATP-binding cassette subfamily B (MDR/TAP) protein 1